MRLFVDGQGPARRRRLSTGGRRRRASGRGTRQSCLTEGARFEANRPRHGNFGAAFQVLPLGYDKSGQDHAMSHAEPISMFSRGWRAGRAAFLTVAILGLLAAASRSPAQDAGVSGIPPGPANARGLNGSISDPSGIGNAARVPAIPPPAISPVIPPTVSVPSAGYRTVPVQRAVRIQRTRFATARSRRAAARAAVRERGRLGDDKFPSICRGC